MFSFHSESALQRCIPMYKQKHRQTIVFFSGLIIDAFGELRDQQEQVKEDMEVRHFLSHTDAFY